MCRKEEEDKEWEEEWEEGREKENDEMERQGMDPMTEARR